MPSLLRVFRRDAAGKSNKKNDPNNAVEPPKPRWEESWSRISVQPDEVCELISVCTQEMKSRALDMPLLLLPFRPGLETIGAKNFIRNYFRARYEGGIEPKALARRELMLMEPIVLCSIMKWCWSRLPGGIVTWDVYETFQRAETDSKMAKDAFEVFVPMSTDSTARTQIIFDFFDLLAAIAARGKTNGLGGRKLSRYAGWWAFEHSDNGYGFDGGYKSWAKAADATSHLFFAYLRSLAPTSDIASSGISKLPRSLQSLLSQTEYPPEAPFLMLKSTSKVVMIVQSVSPTPFSLLRRARNFEYRDDDPTLQEYSNYEDPVKALSAECHRVLESISSANRTATIESNGKTQDPSWSRFEDMGFSSLNLADGLGSQSPKQNGISNAAYQSTTNLDRPTTPSWADFLSTGFPNDRGPTLLPPDQQLPLPVGSHGRGHSSQSHRPGGAQADLEPGELASIGRFDLDETFWWVWMTSLANEETAERKSVFGRCALIETEIAGHPWLLIEEQIKGASPGQQDGAYIAEKRGLFSFRSRLGRRKTTVKKEKKGHEPYDRIESATPSSKIGPDQQAKIQQAAQQLARGQKVAGADTLQQRTRQADEEASNRNSLLSITPLIQSEASTALEWTDKFDSGTLRDKEDIRAQYLGNKTAGTGKPIQSSNTHLASSTVNGTTEQEALNRKLSSGELPSIPIEDKKKVAVKAVAPASPPKVPELTTRKSFVSVSASVEKFQSKANEQSNLKDKEPAKTSVVAENTRSAAFPVAAPAVSSTTSVANNTSATQPTVPVPARVSSGIPIAVKPAPDSKASEPRPSIDSSATTPAPLEGRPSHVSSGNTSPKRLQKKETNGATGFRKLFGRNKPVDKPAVAATPVVQKPKHTPISAPAQIPTSSNKSIEPAPLSPTENTEPTFSEPPYEPEVHGYEADDDRQTALEKLEADREFSKFDQGPLEDMPAFSPVDDVEDAAPPPVVKPANNTRISVLSPPEDSVPRTRSRSPKVNKPEFQIEAGSSDRWAQLRKNAAERAQRMSATERAQRMNESQQPSRHNQQNRQSRSDDGETSGEETIESRVERIRARVKELTGNMDAATTRA